MLNYIINVKVYINTRFFLNYVILRFLPLHQLFSHLIRYQNVIRLHYGKTVVRTTQHLERSVLSIKKNISENVLNFSHLHINIIRKAC